MFAVQFVLWLALVGIGALFAGWLSESFYTVWGIGLVACLAVAAVLHRKRLGASSRDRRGVLHGRRARKARVQPVRVVALPAFFAACTCALAATFFTVLERTPLAPMFWDADLASVEAKARAIENPSVATQIWAKRWERRMSPAARERAAPHYISALRAAATSQVAIAPAKELLVTASAIAAEHSPASNADIDALSQELGRLESLHSALVSDSTESELNEVWRSLEMHFESSKWSLPVHQWGWEALQRDAVTQHHATKLERLVASWPNGAAPQEAVLTLSALRLESGSKELEATRVRRLQMAQDWHGLAAMLGGRKPSELPRDHARALVRSYTKIGQSATGCAARERNFKQALRVAHATGVAADAATKLLSDDELATQRYGRLIEELERLRARNQIAEALARLESELARDVTSPCVSHDALLALRAVLVAEQAAHACSQFKERIITLREAGRAQEALDLVCEALDQGTCQELPLETWRTELESVVLPVVLPQGCTAFVRGIATHSLPTLLADVVIEDASGRRLDSLAAKDFAISLVSCATGGVSVASGTTHGPTTSVVLALDRSGSMDRVLSDAVQAASALLTELGSPGIELSVLTFNSKVDPLGQPWRQNAPSLSRALKLLDAGGGTALYGAAREGIRLLASRHTARHLVLFTDGANSVEGQSVRSVLDAATQAGVVVHTVGLVTKELKEEPLRSLAERTGGHFYRAESSRALATHFRKLGERLGGSFYRLAIPVHGDSGILRDLAITIGRGPTRLELLQRELHGGAQ